LQAANNVLAARLCDVVGSREEVGRIHCDPTIPAYASARNWSRGGISLKEFLSCLRCRPSRHRGGMAIRSVEETSSPPLRVRPCDTQRECESSPAPIMDYSTLTHAELVERLNAFEQAGAKAVTASAAN